MPGQRAAVVGTWTAALAGVVVVLAALRGPDVLAWLAVALLAAVVVGVAGQLAVGEQRGFVVHLAAAACGSLVIVVAGAGVALAAG